MHPEQPNVIPFSIFRMFENSKVSYVRVYTAGWVPMSYKWRAPGIGILYTRDKETNSVVKGTFYYDRKRSYARGSAIAAFSGKNGWVKTRK